MYESGVAYEGHGRTAHAIFSWVHSPRDSSLQPTTCRWLGSKCALKLLGCRVGLTIGLRRLSALPHVPPPGNGCEYSPAKRLSTVRFSIEITTTCWIFVLNLTER